MPKGVFEITRSIAQFLLFVLFAVYVLICGGLVIVLLGKSVAEIFNYFFEESNKPIKKTKRLERKKGRAAEEKKEICNG